MSTLFSTSSRGCRRADLREYGLHRLDRLPQPLLVDRCVRDVEHEVRDECLLERRGESLDQLRRQATNEPDRVGDEVALSVVYERPGRRVECLEQAVVHGGVRSCQCVQERRLTDVRVAGQRDGRSARPLTLLAPGRAPALEAAEAPLDERDSGSRDAAVALELTLTGPAGADAATQPLQVLPHPAHAWKVVLELRELHLKLSLGGPRVLREDVEDELRAIDDAGLQRVLERALLRRAQLLVDQQDLCLGPGVRLLELRELSLADEGPRVRVRAVLHELADRSHTCGTRELAKLGKLALAVHSFRENADDEAALGLRLGAGIGLPHRHRRIMPR